MRICLKVIHFIWENVHAGVTQGSILGSLLLLIHVNDLAEYLSSNRKAFADYTFLFSVVHDPKLMTTWKDWSMSASP